MGEWVSAADGGSGEQDIGWLKVGMVGREFAFLPLLLRTQERKWERSVSKYDYKSIFPDLHSPIMHHNNLLALVSIAFWLVDPISKQSPERHLHFLWNHSVIDDCCWYQRAESSNYVGDLRTRLTLCLRPPSISSLSSLELWIRLFKSDGH